MERALAGLRAEKGGACRMSDDLEMDDKLLSALPKALREDLLRERRTSEESGRPSTIRVKLNLDARGRIRTWQIRTIRDGQDNNRVDTQRVVA